MQKKGYYTDFTQGEDSEKIEFDFSTNISMLGKMNLVKKTVERCIIDEHFFSNLLPVIFNYHIIMYFAAIDLSDIEEAEINGIDKMCDFVQNTNIAEIIRENMDDGVLDELVKAVDADVEFKTGIHPNPLNEVLSRLLETFEKKIENIDVETLIKSATKVAGIKEQLTPTGLINAYNDSEVFNKKFKDLEEHNREINKIVGEIKSKDEK